MDKRGVQRAPGEGPALDVDARVDRLRHAIELNPLLRRMDVEIEAVATALAGMTADDGRAVKKRFEELTTWNLGWLIAGELEIGGMKIGNDIGPKNRRRLLNLLSGTVAETEDPVAAMARAEAVGQTFGDLLGIGDKTAAAAGAQAFVDVRDRNIAREKEASANRLKAQAIEVKVWLDKGQKDKIFALLRSFSTSAKRDERAALDKSYEAEFGDTLYIALTKKFKGRDWDQLGALWDGDITKADALATATKLEKLKEAEAKTQALTSAFGDSNVMGGDFVKKAKKRERDERAALEQHLDDLAQQPAEPGAPQGTSQLEAVLDEGSDGSHLRQSLKARKDVAVEELVSKNKRPELLAVRLARSERDGTLKPTDIEDAMRELRAVAESDAAREAAAPPTTVLAEVGTTTAPVEKPPTSPRLLADSYLARFEARFDAESPRPLSVVVMSKGSLEERERNAALYVNAGDIPEWQQMYYAIRTEKKDLDRVRKILGGKNKGQIQVLIDEYNQNAPGELKRDMVTDLLGTLEYQRRIRHPSTDDFMRGRLPKDLGQARTEHDEIKNLLRGGVFEPSAPSSGERETSQLAVEIVATQQDPRGLGGPPLPDQVVKSIAMSAAQGTTVRELREEAKFVFDRITTKGVSAEYNRGTFARVRDKIGNAEYAVLKQTSYDAELAMKALDDALYKDPPDIDSAAKVVSKLYLIDARIAHNISVYQERTEAAFDAFVDAAVMIATTLATAGQGGAILMAIRATAATVATKVTLKGGDYSADEFWGDIRGGVFNAVGGKLSEKLVGGLSSAIAVRYAARAEKLGLTKSWRTWLVTNAGAAAKWEAENLISGVSAGIAEAAVTGNDEAIYTPMSLGSHIESAGQDLAQTGIRGVRVGRGRRRQERAIAKAKAKAAQKPAVSTAAPATQGSVAAGETSIAGDTGSGEQTGVPGDVRDLLTAPLVSGGDDAPARQRDPGVSADDPAAPSRRRPAAGDDDAAPTKNKTRDEIGNAADSPRIADRPSETGRPIDALRAGTGADARARVKAAEFESLFDKWEGMKPEQRRAEIEGLLNEQLVREGGHPIKVAFGPMKAGDADFNLGTWTVRISTDSLNQPTLTVREFAVLTGASVHEARHALHFFRAVRVGLARGNLKTASIDAGVLARAIEANKRSDPQDEFSPQAHDELLEIADVSFNKERRKKQYGPDAIDPDKVIAEMQSKRGEARAAADAYDKVRKKVEALQSAGKAGTQEYIDAHREATAAYADAVAKDRAAHEAYLKYPALPEETEAWRIQLATEAAVEERLMTRTELQNAQRARQLAAQERRMARERKDPGAAEAIAAADERVRQATTEVQRLQQQLDNLARGGEPKARRASPDEPAPALAAEGPARRTNVNVVRRRPPEAPAGPRPTNVNVIPRPPAGDVGGDTQVDIAPAGSQVDRLRSSQSDDSRPLPRPSTGSPSDSAPTAPDSVRSVLGPTTRADASQPSAPTSSEPATAVATGPATVGQGTGASGASGTSAARKGVFGSSSGDVSSAVSGGGSTIVRSQPPPPGPPGIGSGSSGSAPTPLGPGSVGGPTGNTPTVPQPGTPSQLPAGQQFTATAGSEANRLSPRVEQLSVGQWSEIRPVGEGINLKFILTDRVTGEQWMFKPASGEEGMLFGPDLGIQAGERWRRALAAAYLSQDLGLNTPYVRLVQIGQLVGSLQEWRQGYEARPRTQGDPQAEFDRFWNSRHRHDIDAFDYFIANQDRHERNVMIKIVDGQPKTMLIDQDAGIPPTPDRFSTVAPPAGEDLDRWQRDMPPSVTGELADRFRDLAAHFPEAELRKWLTDAEVDGLWARLNQVVDGLDSGRIGIIEESTTRTAETAPRPGTGPGRPPPSGGGGSGGASAGSGTVSSSGSGTTGAPRVNVNVIRRPPPTGSGTETTDAPTRRTGTLTRTGSNDATSTRSGTPTPGSGTSTVPRTSGPPGTANEVSTLPRSGGGATRTAPARSKAEPIDAALRNVTPTVAPQVPTTTATDARPLAGPTATGEGKVPPPTDTQGPKAAEVVSLGPQPLAGPQGNAQVSAADAIAIDVDTERQTAQGPRQSGWGGSATGNAVQVERRAGGPGGQTSGSFIATGQDVGFEVGKQTPGKGGPTAGVKLDSHGNPTVEVGWNIQGRGGSHLKPTYSHGQRVDAAEPVELEEGRFVVVYSMSETTTAGLGGGMRKAPAGGFGWGAGGNVSTSESESKQGTRIFKTKPEAEAFRNTAALVLAFDSTLEAPTTAADAKKIPKGETRGRGETQGQSAGISGSFGGTTLGRNWQGSETTGVSFYRVSDDLLNVSTTVTKDKAADWGISGLILANQKGDDTTTAYGVTVQFNISTSAGENALSLYLKTGVPLMTGAKIVSVMKMSGGGSYDRYQMPGFGTAGWSDKSWQKETVDEEGVTKEYGGSQTHEQDPTWLAELTGDEELYSSAQLVSQQIRGKEKYTATINIKSETGEYNREQFGRIFLGAKAKGPVKQSGAWTLSAEIDKDVVHELERVSDKFKGAKDRDDKQKILSEVFRKSGAGMAGGLVRHGGRFMLAWDLELKGDPNFPGARGRDKLAMQREELAKKLKSSPEAAAEVVRTVQEVLNGLAARRKGVKDPEKYTDLPDELRQQQLALIDRHVYEFNQVRSNALMAAGRHDPKESIEAIRARIDKPDAYGDLKPDKREIASLQDKVADKDVAINEIRSRIEIALEAVRRARVQDDIPEKYKKHYMPSRMALRESDSLHKDQKALGLKAQELRSQAFNAADPPAQTEAWRQLEETVSRRYLALTLQLQKIKDAGAELVPITEPESRWGEKYDEFWAPIEESAEDEPEEGPRGETYTAMALEEPKKPKRNRRR